MAARSQSFNGQGDATSFKEHFSCDIPLKRTLQPSTTGTSVLGVKFNGGVMLAADMLGSYGSMARFRDISRLMKVTNDTVIAAGGDIADYQFLKSIIEQKVIDEELLDDGFNFTPRGTFSWLTRVLYNRRSRFNPLWNTYIVGGLHDDETLLGYVSMKGVAFESPTVATGFGAYLAQPVLREAFEKNPNMSEDEAKEVLVRCLRLLYYRDARSYNKFQIAIVTKDGVKISEPQSADTNWSVAHYVKGYE